MASDLHRIRLRWLTPDGVSDSVTVKVRSVSERGAFAMLATSHGAGTRGRYELLDEAEEVVRAGSCRIIFQRKGIGVGLELLPVPPMRRSEVPSSILDPSSRFGGETDSNEEDDANGERPTRRRRRSSQARTTAGERPSVKAPSSETYDGTCSNLGPANTSRSDAPSSKPPNSEASKPGDTPDRPSRASFESTPKDDSKVSKAEFERRPTEQFQRHMVDLTDEPTEPTMPQVPRAMVEEAVDGFSEPTGPEVPSRKQGRPIPKPDAHAPTLPVLAGEVEQEEEEPNVNVDRSSYQRHDMDEEPTMPARPSLISDLPPAMSSEPPELTYEEVEPDEVFSLAPDELPSPLPEEGWQSPPPSPPPEQWATPEFDLAEYDPPSIPVPGIPAPPPSNAPRTKREPSIIVEPSLAQEAAKHAKKPQSPAARSPHTARLATRITGTGASGVTIGIDLGTSNICASVVRDGVPQVLATRFGTNTLPSVLTVIDGRIVVGHAAVKRMILNPHETVYGSKRLIGRAYTSELADEYQPSFAYPLVETEDHRFGASIKGRVISFEQVAEYLLADVRDVAEHELNARIYDAVITVPAYFGEAQREAVRRAAHGARLQVSRIVPEPTAAAVAYGFDATEEHVLVVFDLGGGTFDVSVLRVGNKRFEVLATGGDPFLGGIDIDDMIAGFLLDEFNRAERTTIEPTPQQLARLRGAAEECKRDLSVQQRVNVSLPHFAHIDGKPKELRVTMARTTLDKLATGFVDRLITITAGTLADCRLLPTEIDEILLVGGMTRMGLIPKRVEEYFGQRPSRRINPDEAVALGAARLAASGGGVTLRDVLPLSIGVATKNRRFQRLIARNTQVPAEKGFSIHTLTKDQTTYAMPLFQGERVDAAENEYLGTLMIEEIPPGPKGSEIDLQFSLDDQCFLEVKAAHAATGRGLAVYIRRDEGADKAIARLEDFNGPEEEKRPKKKVGGLGRFFKKLRAVFLKNP